jgi:AcrR family transcriptional regulator
MNADVKETQFPRRAAKAARTRQTVIEAAERQFVARGYGSTSVSDVARAAGVSRATVFNSVGGKPALLRACYDMATVGDADPVPLPQRPAMLAIRDEADAHRSIALYAEVIAEIGERLSGIYEVFRAAAGTDAEIQAQWAQIQAERLAGSHRFVQILADKGGLRLDLDPAEAGDVVWTYIDVGLYHRLVVERGWSSPRFQAWFTRSLAQFLLEPWAQGPPGVEPSKPGKS